LHFPELGGRRRARPDSPNKAWRNAAFRGYADYMETTEFEKGIAELLVLARAKRSAVMCAEALYYGCHRSLVSDALVCRGVETVHLLGVKRTAPHRLTAFVKIEDGRPTYPSAQPTLPVPGADEEE